jgi:hypothetical protein
VEHFDLDHRAFAFPHSNAGVRAEFFKEMRDTWQLQVSFWEQPGCAGTFSRGTSSDLAWRTHRFRQLKSLG